MTERLPPSLRADQINLITIIFLTARMNLVNRFEVDKFRTFPGNRVKCPNNYHPSLHADQIILIIIIFLTARMNPINRFEVDKFR